MWPLVDAKLAERRQQVLLDLDKAVSERNIASGIGER